MALHIVLIGMAFISGMMMLAFAVYAGARLIVGDRFGQSTQDLAGSVIFRVSALHGLILALVFAQEIDDYHALREGLVREATMVGDLYNDAWRHGGDWVPEVQAALAQYVRVAAGDEWRSLARDRRLDAEGWRLREVVYQQVLDLDPQTPRQTALRDHMLDRVEGIAELRQQRENAAIFRLSPLFWVAALSGTIPYFVFPPTRLNLSLLGVYAGYSGLVMFIIYAFSNPFAGPGGMTPDAFLRLLEGEIGQTGDPPR